jgi:hypothetical protein
LHRVTLALIFLCTLPATAGYEAPGLCGFFDAGLTAGLEDETNFDGLLGALEVDVEGEFTDWCGYAAGLVLEKGGSEVGVDFAATLLDLHLPEAEGFLTTTGVYLGVFDVPFGWDFLRYPAPDRPTFSAPLTTEAGFDGGMTELGFAAYTRTALFDLDAYLLYLPPEASEIAGEPDTPDRWVYGARLDVLPGVDWLHVGGSAVMFNEGAEDEEVEARRYGGHLRLEGWGLELTGEYVLGSDGVDDAVDSSGYYAELVYRLDEIFAPVYIFTRYGSWDPDTSGGDDELTQIAAGLGYAPLEWLAFKLEYTANGEPGDVKNDAVTLDAVVAF